MRSSTQFAMRILVATEFVADCMMVPSADDFPQLPEEELKKRTKNKK
jgi:hypothetical protein